MAAPTERLARCGCGVTGRIIELDDRRPSSLDYSFTIETENGEIHVVHAEWLHIEARYKMEHLAP